MTLFFWVDISHSKSMSKDKLTNYRIGDVELEEDK